MLALPSTPQIGFLIVSVPGAKSDLGSLPVQLVAYDSMSRQTFGKPYGLIEAGNDKGMITTVHEAVTYFCTVSRPARRTHSELVLTWFRRSVKSRSWTIFWRRTLTRRLVRLASGGQLLLQSQPTENVSLPRPKPNTPGSPTSWTSSSRLSDRSE